MNLKKNELTKNKCREQIRHISNQAAEINKGIHYVFGSAESWQQEAYSLWQDCCELQESYFRLN